MTPVENHPIWKLFQACPGARGVAVPYSVKGLRNSEQFRKPMNTDEFIKPEDIAKEMGVSVRTVQNWANSHRIPVVKFGRNFLIPRAAWKTWLSQQAQTALSNVHTSAGAEQDV